MNYAATLIIRGAMIYMLIPAVYAIVSLDTAVLNGLSLGATLVQESAAFVAKLKHVHVRMMSRKLFKRVVRAVPVVT